MEAVEALPPEVAVVLQPVRDGIELRRHQAEVAHAAVLLVFDESGVLQHREVLDDRRKRYIERVRQLAHRGGTRGQALGDRASRWVGEGTEHRIETGLPILHRSVKYNDYKGGVDMARFLVLYRAPVSAREQMANVTPEQAQAGMELWMAWAGKAGDAIVDLGAPLGDVAIVGEGEAYGDLAGYSILEAASRDVVMELLQEHPHLHTPGGHVEVHETLPVPGT